MRLFSTPSWSYLLFIHLLNKQCWNNEHRETQPYSSGWPLSGFLLRPLMEKPKLRIHRNFWKTRLSYIIITIYWKFKSDTSHIPDSIAHFVRVIWLKDVTRQCQVAVGPVKVSVCCYFGVRQEEPLSSSCPTLATWRPPGNESLDSGVPSSLPLLFLNFINIYYF